MNLDGDFELNFEYNLQMLDEKFSSKSTQEAK